VAVATDLDLIRPQAMPASRPAAAFAGRAWKATWPKVLAVAIVIGAWQLAVWSHWKPEYLVPSPFTVLDRLFHEPGKLLTASLQTLRRGFQGFVIAMIIGTVVGVAVARVKVLRAAIGSMITGLQTMPSVAWFPAAVLIFHLSESAIIFVVVLGAAPSIANGLINGIDNIPPVLLRASRVLGARRFTAFRNVILPAALPSFVGGLKQGWAFAWRSLLAGELLVLIPGKHSLGEQLDYNRGFGDAAGIYALMIVIFVIGVCMDAFVFGAADRWVRRRYGLIDTATT